jgi:hypothetical protein
MPLEEVDRILGEPRRINGDRLAGEDDRVYGADADLDPYPVPRVSVESEGGRVTAVYTRYVLSRSD